MAEVSEVAHKLTASQTQQERVMAEVHQTKSTMEERMQQLEQQNTSLKMAQKALCTEIQRTLTAFGTQLSKGFEAAMKKVNRLDARIQDLEQMAWSAPGVVAPAQVSAAVPHSPHSPIHSLAMCTSTPKTNNPCTNPRFPAPLPPHASPMWISPTPSQPPIPAQPLAPQSQPVQQGAIVPWMAPGALQSVPPPAAVQVGASVLPVPQLLPASVGVASPISAHPATSSVMAVQTQPPVPQMTPLAANPATVSMVTSQVAPVNIGAPAPMMMANPASYILAQCLGLPEPFDGTRAHWPDWVAKWKVWLASAFMGQQPDEGAMIIALLRCLPPSCVRELQRRFEDPSGRPVQFSEYWAWLEREYGGDGDTIALANLRGLDLKSGGKLTLATWREYCSDLRLRRSRVTDLTEDEARSLVVRRLPQFWTDKLADEEARRGQRHPWVRVAGLGSLREEQMRAFVEAQTL